MSNKLTREEVTQELGHCFSSTVSHVEPISTGHFSEGWYFSQGNNQYVIRFAHPRLADSLRKDHYVSTRLVGPGVPVARFVQMGDSTQLGLTRHYAITERAEGVILDEIPAQQYKQLVPALVSILHNIHRSDIGHTQGWGSITSAGEGLSSSWRDFLLKVSQEADTHGHYNRWHKLFDESFLEKALFTNLYHQLEENLQFCPEQRWLLHADYAFDNVLAKGNRITAVIDWSNALFGDFLFDVARQELLQPEWGFLDKFIELYQQENIAVPNIRERLNCYQCYFTLDAMRFYASIDSKDGYEWVKGKARVAGLIAT